MVTVVQLFFCSIFLKVFFFSNIFFQVFERLASNARESVNAVYCRSKNDFKKNETKIKIKNDENEFLSFIFFRGGLMKIMKKQIKYFLCLLKCQRRNECCLKRINSLKIILLKTKFFEHFIFANEDQSVVAEQFRHCSKLYLRWSKLM